MADYPSNYPSPLLEGNELRRVNNLAQTELATGLMVQREIAPNPPFRTRIKIAGQGSDIVDVLDWVENTAALDWFRIPLPRANASFSGTGYKSIRRVSVIDQRYMGNGLYEISFEAEVKPG